MKTNAILSIEIIAQTVKAADDMHRFTKDVDRDMDNLTKKTIELRNVFSNLFVGLSIAAFGNKLIEVQREFDKLNASLITASGSAEIAKANFAWIKDFAATTPFSLKEVTQAFVTLKMVGIDASSGVLTSLGNTASAIGISLDQVIQAVSDASTSSFERLVEAFKIKYSQTKEFVTFTFKGVSTTIANNSTEIIKYLVAIGNTDFAGAMNERAKTLDGAISNLADNWDNLFLTISQQGVGSLIHTTVMIGVDALKEATEILQAFNLKMEDSKNIAPNFGSVVSGAFRTIALGAMTVYTYLEQVGIKLATLAASWTIYFKDGSAAARKILDEGKSNAQKSYDEYLHKSNALIDANSEEAKAAREQAAAHTLAQAKLLAETNAKEDAANKTKKLAAAEEQLKKATEKKYAEVKLSAQGLNKDYTEKREELDKMHKYVDDKQFKEMLDALEKEQPRYRELQKGIAKARKDSSSEILKSANEEDRQLKAFAEAELRRENEKKDDFFAADLKRIDSSYDAIKSVREYTEDVEFETKTLKMNNVEREIAIQMRKLERDEVGLTAGQLEEERKALRKAIIDRNVVDTQIKEQERLEAESQKIYDQIGQSLTDALMDGGKKGSEYIKGLFRSMILRPILQPIVAGAMSMFGFSPAALASVVGAGGAGGDGGDGSLSKTIGLGSIVGTIKSTYDLVSGAVAGFGANVTSAVSNLGEWLSTNLGFNLIGSYAQSIGNAAGFIVPAYAGMALGNLFSGGKSIGGNQNYATGAGALLGSYLLPGMGGIIGGGIGGLVNSAFGMGATELRGQGIRGKLTSGGADISAYTQYHKDGGWFRSDKNWESVSEAPRTLDALLDASLKTTSEATKRYANILGGAAKWVDGFSQTIDISLKGLNEEQQQKAIADALSGFGDNLIKSIFPRDAFVISQFSRTGETVGQTFARLATSLESVNKVLEIVNGHVLRSNAYYGAAASSLIDLFGGMEKFTQATDAYYQSFYSDSERTAASMSQLSKTFNDLGLSLPVTTEQFRDLVDAQNLLDESGRKTFTALLSVSSSFATLVNSIQSSIGLTIDGINGIFSTILQNAKNEEEARQQATAAAADFVMQAVTNSMINSISSIINTAILQPLAQGIVGAATAASSALVTGGTVGGEAVAVGGYAAGESLSEIVGKATDTINTMAAVLSDDKFKAAFTDAVIAIGNLGGSIYSSVSQVSSAVNLGSYAITPSVDSSAVQYNTAQDNNAFDSLIREHKELQIEWMRLAGDMAKANEAARMLATEGMSSIEVAAYDANQKLREQIDLETERQRKKIDIDTERLRLEDELLRAQGDVTAIRKKELDAIDDTNKSLQESIWATQDYNAIKESEGNYQDVLAGLNNKIDRLSSIEKDGVNYALMAYDDYPVDYNNPMKPENLMADIRKASAALKEKQEEIELNKRLITAEGDLKAIRELELKTVDPLNRELLKKVWATEDKASLIDLIGKEIDDILGAAQSGVMSQRSAMSFIDSAILNARIPYNLPDKDELANAINAVKSGFATNNYSSAFDMRRDQLVFAGKLSKLDEQLGMDELQLQAANNQIIATNGLTTSINNLNGTISGNNLGVANVSGFAAGGLFGGGLRLVGENGPELEVTGPARYYSASQTSEMMGGGREVVVELRQFREESRAQSRALAQLQSRMTRVLERWDGDGIPEERAVA